MSQEVLQVVCKTPFFFRKPWISRHLSDECLIKLCHLHQLLSHIHQKSADPKIPWMLTSTSGALFLFEPLPPAPPRVSFALSEIITAPKHRVEGHAESVGVGGSGWSECIWDLHVKLRCGSQRTWGRTSSERGWRGSICLLKH